MPRQLEAQGPAFGEVANTSHDTAAELWDNVRVIQLFRHISGNS